MPLAFRSDGDAAPGLYLAASVEEDAVLELIRQAGQLLDAAHVWFLAQSLPMQILAGAGALAVLWVVWIVLRVLLVALRAAFRGL